VETVYVVRADREAEFDFSGSEPIDLSSGLLSDVPAGIPSVVANGQYVGVAWRFEHTLEKRGLKAYSVGVAESTKEGSDWSSGSSFVLDGYDADPAVCARDPSIFTYDGSVFVAYTRFPLDAVMEREIRLWRIGDDDSKTILTSDPGGSGSVDFVQGVGAGGGIVLRAERSPGGWTATDALVFAVGIPDSFVLGFGGLSWTTHVLDVGSTQLPGRPSQPSIAVLGSKLFVGLSYERTTDEWRFRCVSATLGMFTGGF
jgi:hypothetical protein